MKKAGMILALLLCVLGAASFYMIRGSIPDELHMVRGSGKEMTLDLPFV